MFKECQQQMLAEFHGQRKLTSELPEAIKEKQENGRLLLKTGMGVGGVGTAMAERVPGL